MKILIAFMAFAGLALAQNSTFMQGGTSLPASCTGNQVFNRTGVTAPGIYQCSGGTYVLNAASGSVNSVTASAPFTSSGGANPNISATVQGNGSKVQLSTGTTTTNDCVKFDANGNTVDAGAACGAGAGILPFALSNTTTVITIGASNPSGVPGVAINTTLSVNAQSTFTVTGGTGSVYIGLSGGSGGTTAGTVTVNHNITGTCSGCTAQVTTPAYDDNAFQIGQCSVTAGAITSCTSAVTAYRIQPTIAGTGLTKTVASGVATWAAPPVQYPFSALTDGATISWDTLSAQNSNRTLLFTTHGGARTINMVNMISGGNYVIRTTQDGTGGENITGGTGCTWKQPGGAGSTFTLTATAGAIDTLAFTYDGTNCLVIPAKAY